MTELRDDALDAARYRWLREHVEPEYARKSINPEFIDNNMKWQIKPYLIAMTCVMSEVTFDDAIDMAMNRK